MAPGEFPHNPRCRVVRSHYRQEFPTRATSPGFQIVGALPSRVAKRRPRTALCR